MNKRFNEFNEDCYNAIYDATEKMVCDIIKMYDYQKDIPNAKKLIEKTRMFDKENSSNKILKQELSSCVKLSNDIYSNFLEAKEIYVESGRRGTYKEYMENLLVPISKEVYPQMDELMYEYDNELPSIINNIFNKMDELTDKENNKEEIKYIVLKDILQEMDSPYLDEIMTAEKEIMRH